MELKTPIKFEDLLKGPVTLQMDLANQSSLEEENDLTADVVDAPIAQSSPWLESFADLRQQMVEVPGTSGKIFKRIIKNGVGEPMQWNRCRIQWTYSLFYEKQTESFDSSHFEASSIMTAENDKLLVGLTLAVVTMRKNESAEFVIDHNLMFGKKGILIDEGVYHRQPGADILACITLHDFIEICDDRTTDDDDVMPRTFQETKDFVRLAKNNLAEAKSKNKHVIALNIGNKAVQQLQFCELKDESEKAERAEVLVYFYTQMADCYIRCENWRRALLMCKELRQLTNVDQNVELLLIQAIATGHLNDDYKLAIELLRKAQKLEPHNLKVNGKMGEFIKAERKQRSNESDFCRRAFGAAVQAKPPSEYDEEMEKLVGSIERMDLDESVPLIGYTKRQLDAIEQIIQKKVHLTLQKTPGMNGEIRYAIKKNNY